MFYKLTKFILPIIASVLLLTSCQQFFKLFNHDHGNDLPIPTCKVAPQAMNCTKEYVPVCGCDGVTYPNKCIAVSNGVIDYKLGACGTQPPIDSTNTGGNDCVEQKPDPTAVCPAIYAPVCGCNGKTYENECVAKTYGIRKKYDGICK